MPLMNFCQLLPRSVETYAPTDVPTNRRSRLNGSSRTTCTWSGPPVGRLAAIDEKFFPPSVVTYKYGVKSLVRWLSNEMYQVSVSKCEGSTRLTYTSLFGKPGNFFQSICVQVAPSFGVIHTLPSSVPAYSKPGLIYDS